MADLHAYLVVVERGGLHTRLREAAERFPEHKVLITPTRTASYGELHRLSGRIAASLLALGIRSGDRVAIATSSAMEYMAAYYGVFKAGAVAVPHSPDTRAALLGHCLRHSEARAVVLDAELVRLLDGQSSKLRALEQIIPVGAPSPVPPPGLCTTAFTTLAASSREVHDAGAGGDDLASLVYTSGTTGEPKGVMLSHHNLVANARSIIDYLELGPDDVGAMVLPFHYAYGTSVMTTHIAAGGALAMVGSLAFPAAMLTAMQDFGCTGFAGVPSTFAHLARIDVSTYDLSSLRYVTQAGGPMSPALTRKVMATFPHARLFVMYGQTEATARLTFLPPEQLERKLGSVGIPIPGVAIDVVDEAGLVVPAGGQGEVIARGANVMLGYWRDPDGTTRVLRPEGLRTGDLGYKDADGYLHLVARQNEMIKSGGHRVGPREIEEVIEDLAGVAECGVVGVPDELLGEAIAALVVTRDGSTVDAMTVRRHVLGFLPRHKVPQVVRFVPTLPRTGSGKVCRADLRRLALGGA